MRIRKYCRSTDTLYLYHEMEKAGLLSEHMIGDDIAFCDFLEHQLRYYYSDFWMIEDRKSGQQKGFVYTYDYRIRDGHCILDYHLDCTDEQKRKELLTYVMDMLFRENPLHCLYLYVDDDDKEKAELFKALGARQEAFLREYQFRNGRFVDVRIMNLQRISYADTGK